MKVILYMGISLDGYIAKTNYSTDWISEKDFEIFDKKVREYGCIIMGNTTFQEVGITPNIQNIIMSNSAHKKTEDNIHFASSTLEAINIGKELGFSEILIIGGGKCNASFLRENLIDEIIVDIQPVILGKGIKIFEDIEKFVELEFIEHRNLEGGLNILKYKVKK